MEADDESIFYKYDAKATKYGDLLFFFGRRVLCLLARGPWTLGGMYFDRKRPTASLWQTEL